MGIETEVLLAFIKLLYMYHIKRYATTQTTSEKWDKNFPFPDLLLISATLDPDKYYTKMRTTYMLDAYNIKHRPNINEVIYEMKSAINKGQDIEGPYRLEDLAHGKWNLDISDAQKNFESEDGEDKGIHLFPATIQLMFQAIRR